MSKKFKTRLTFLLLAIIIGAGVSQMEWINDTHKHITPTEAAAMIQSDPSVIIVDVRREDEYVKKHIPNAVLLPIEKINAGQDIETTLPDKNRPLLLYCQTGRRAENAASKLAKMGYKHVYEFGGLVEWTGATEGEE